MQTTPNWFHLYSQTSFCWSIAPHRLQSELLLFRAASVRPLGLQRAGPANCPWSQGWENNDMFGLDIPGYFASPVAFCPTHLALALQLLHCPQQQVSVWCPYIGFFHVVCPELPGATSNCFSSMRSLGHQSWRHFVILSSMTLTAQGSSWPKVIARRL